MIIGIDVGGTNTDVAYLSENQLKTFKFPNELGIDKILSRISKEVDVKNSKLIISTSQPMNILTSQFDSVKVLSLIFPGPGLNFSNYGEVMKGYVNHRGIYVEKIDEKEIAERLEKRDYDAVAISAKFSVRNPEIEHEVMEIAKRYVDEKKISLSHHVGLINFPLRIGTTIVNAKISESVFRLTETIRAIKEDFFYYKGDGGVIPWKIAVRNPSELYNSSPAAVAFGAYYLTRIKDALIIDIGGTTTDFVVLRDGRPEIIEKVEINGLKTHIRCVNALSIPFGGDSVFRDELRPYREGKGIAFGGGFVTLTDLLNAVGHEIGNYKASRDKVDTGKAEREVERYVERVAELAREFEEKTIVGTGYLAPYLIPQIAELSGKKFVVPEHYASANAVGVAVSRISLTLYARFDTEKRIAVFNGEIDQEWVEKLTGHPDDEELIEMAISKLREIGLRYGASERDVRDVEIVYFNSFNIVREGIRRGKIADVVVQIKPGLCCDVL